VKREDVLSEREVLSLVSHIEKAAVGANIAGATSRQVDEIVIVTLLFSGLRNSEFCGLAVRDLVCSDGEWSFQVRSERGAGRVVHIARSVGEKVAAYVDGLRARLLGEGGAADGPAGPLFVNERGRAFDRTSLYRRVVRVLKDAGFGDRASVQLLRHTYGYLGYLRTGGNLLFVQRQLGHAHPRITSVYARLVEESYADLAERVAGEIGESVPGSGGPEPCRPKFNCETD
jgi:site-specific recombinase XerD